MKQRGVEQIDLVVSDALQGIENAVCAAFPVPHTSSAWHTSSDRYSAAHHIKTNR
nr:transposase [Prevotella corporis]